VSNSLVGCVKYLAKKKVYAKIFIKNKLINLLKEAKQNIVAKIYDNS
jgi:hypothetical protein